MFVCSLRIDIQIINGYSRSYTFGIKHVMIYYSWFLPIIVFRVVVDDVESLLLYVRELAFPEFPVVLYLILTTGQFTLIYKTVSLKCIQLNAIYNKYVFNEFYCNSSCCCYFSFHLIAFVHFSWFKRLWMTKDLQMKEVNVDKIIFKCH